MIDIAIIAKALNAMAKAYSKIKGRRWVALEIEQIAYAAELLIDMTGDQRTELKASLTPLAQKYFFGEGN